MKHVTIIIGSESDKHIADKSVEVLEKYDIPYDLQVGSAHRTPEKVKEIVQNADSDVFICIAGLSAALPGFVASLTPKPVIGVPVDAKLGGLDALLSIAQMPPGVPVATVGIDNGKNGAYLALRILATKYPEILTTRPSEASFSSSSGVVPDFMRSSTPDEPVNIGGFFGSTESSTVEGTAEVKKKPRGDWL